MPLFPFDNTYARLPDRFYARLDPVAVARPVMLRVNNGLAAELGLDAEALAAAPEILAGNSIPEGSEPIAMAYAGHQFGNFVPQLGDGRAILLGEVIDRKGQRRDIQLKGSGRTPFSRRGDGRAALGPVLREYIVSEAMHALDVPTTRSLAAVATGEPVYREDALPGAVLTRVGSSHIRVGTFQFFAARGDLDGVKQLADYVIARHYPEAKEAAQPYLALLAAIAERQAALIARWMEVGFIHGVMNTDNMAVSGETIDFGPCAFMDRYGATTVFSSIDHWGRYAYANQPKIAQWNLARLAETLLPIMAEDPQQAVELATQVIADFPGRYQAYWLAGMRRKLGLESAEEGDLALAESLLEAMEAGGADYTLTFRRLGEENPAALQDWLGRWGQRLQRDSGDPQTRRERMRQANPLFIPRNHRVEAALEAAVQRGDLGPFETLLKILARPFEDQPDVADFAEPPPPSDRVYQTFCGT